MATTGRGMANTGPGMANMAMTGFSLFLLSLSIILKAIRLHPNASPQGPFPYLVTGVIPETKPQGSIIKIHYLANVQLGLTNAP